MAELGELFYNAGVAFEGLEQIEHLNEVLASIPEEKVVTVKLNSDALIDDLYGAFSHFGREAQRAEDSILSIGKAMSNVFTQQRITGKGSAIDIGQTDAYNKATALTINQLGMIHKLQSAIKGDASKGYSKSDFGFDYKDAQKGMERYAEQYETLAATLRTILTEARSVGKANGGISNREGKNVAALANYAELAANAFRGFLAAKRELDGKKLSLPEMQKELAQLQEKFFGITGMLETKGRKKNGVLQELYGLEGFMKELNGAELKVQDFFYKAGNNVTPGMRDAMKQLRMAMNRTNQEINLSSLEVAINHFMPAKGSIAKLRKQLQEYMNDETTKYPIVVNMIGRIVGVENAGEFGLDGAYVPKVPKNQKTKSEDQTKPSNEVLPWRGKSGSLFNKIYPNETIEKKKQLWPIFEKARELAADSLKGIKDEAVQISVIKGFMDTFKKPSEQKQSKPQTAGKSEEPKQSAEKPAQKESKPEPALAPTSQTQVKPEPPKPTPKNEIRAILDPSYEPEPELNPKEDFLRKPFGKSLTDFIVEARVAKNNKRLKILQAIQNEAEDAISESDPTKKKSLLSNIVSSKGVSDLESLADQVKNIYRINPEFEESGDFAIKRIESVITKSEKLSKKIQSATLSKKNISEFDNEVMSLAREIDEITTQTNDYLDNVVQIENGEVDFKWEGGKTGKGRRNGRNRKTPSIPKIDYDNPAEVGGKVVGPGTRTSDSITLHVSNGEYVINAKATDTFEGVLDAVNAFGLNKGKYTSLLSELEKIGVGTGSLVTDQLNVTAANVSINSATTNEPLEGGSYNKDGEAWRAQGGIVKTAEDQRNQTKIDLENAKTTGASIADITKLENQLKTDEANLLSVQQTESKLLKKLSDNIAGYKGAVAGLEIAKQTVHFGEAFGDTASLEYVKAIESIPVLEKQIADFEALIPKDIKAVQAINGWNVDFDFDKEKQKIADRIWNPSQSDSLTELADQIAKLNSEAFNAGLDPSESKFIQERIAHYQKLIDEVNNLGDAEEGLNKRREIARQSNKWDSEDNKAITRQITANKKAEKSYLKLAKKINEALDGLKVKQEEAEGNVRDEIDKSVSELESLIAELNNTSPVDADKVEDIEKRFNGTKTKFKNGKDEVLKALNKISQGANGLQNIFIQTFSLTALKHFYTQLVEIGGEFEKQHIALKSILGDSYKADKIFSQMKGLAVESPFTFQQLTGYSKQLTAFSIPYREVFDTTKRLADISAGLGIDMSRIILAYGQVRSAEFLRGQELRQFTEAGIPLLDQLAKRFTALEGRVVSVGEVFERISKRQVSFGMVKDILWDLTDEGGQFYNMQAQLTDTLSGQMAKLKDQWQIALSEMSEMHNGALRFIISGITSIAENWKSVSVILAGIAAGAAMKQIVANVAGVSKHIYTAVNTLKHAKDLTGILKMSARNVNLWVALLSVLAGVIAALYQAHSVASEFNDKLAKNAQEAAESTERETAALNGLLAKLKNAQKGTLEYQKIVNKISSQYGEYLSFQISEADNYDRIALAASGAADAIERKYRIEQEAKDKQVIEDKYSKDFDILRENIKNNAIRRGKMSKTDAESFSRDITSKLRTGSSKDEITKYLSEQSKATGKAIDISILDFFGNNGRYLGNYADSGTRLYSQMQSEISGTQSTTWKSYGMIEAIETLRKIYEDKFFKEAESEEEKLGLEQQLQHDIQTLVMGAKDGVRGIESVVLSRNKAKGYKTLSEILGHEITGVSEDVARILNQFSPGASENIGYGLNKENQYAIEAFNEEANIKGTMHDFIKKSREFFNPKNYLKTGKYHGKKDYEDLVASTTDDRASLLSYLTKNLAPAAKGLKEEISKIEDLNETILKSGGTLPELDAENLQNDKEKLQRIKEYFDFWGIDMDDFIDSLSKQSKSESEMMERIQNLKKAYDNYKHLVATYGKSEAEKRWNDTYRMQREFKDINTADLDDFSKTLNKLYREISRNPKHKKAAAALNDLMITVGIDLDTKSMEIAARKFTSKLEQEIKQFDFYRSLLESGVGQEEAARLALGSLQQSLNEQIKSRLVENASKVLRSTVLGEIETIVEDKTDTQLLTDATQQQTEQEAKLTEETARLADDVEKLNGEKPTNKPSGDSNKNSIPLAHVGKSPYYEPHISDKDRNLGIQSEPSLLAVIASAIASTGTTATAAPVSKKPTNATVETAGAIQTSYSDDKYKTVNKKGGMRVQQETDPTTAILGRPTTNSQEMIVLHHTGGDSGKGVINSWAAGKNENAGAHVVIERDGTRTELAETNQVAWHAGNSMWHGQEDVNPRAIGIEMVGYGKNTQNLTEAEIDSAVEYILNILKTKFIPLENIVTHTEITPLGNGSFRKDDVKPGDADIIRSKLYERYYKKVYEDALKEADIATKKGDFAEQSRLLRLAYQNRLTTEAERRRKATSDKRVYDAHDKDLRERHGYTNQPDSVWKAYKYRLGFGVSPRAFLDAQPEKISPIEAKVKNDPQKESSSANTTSAKPKGLGLIFLDKQNAETKPTTATPTVSPIKMETLTAGDVDISSKITELTSGQPTTDETQRDARETAVAETTEAAQGKTIAETAISEVQSKLAQLPSVEQLLALSPEEVLSKFGEEVSAAIEKLRSFKSISLSEIGVGDMKSWLLAQLSNYGVTSDFISSNGGVIELSGAEERFWSDTSGLGLNKKDVAIVTSLIKALASEEQRLLQEQQKLIQEALTGLNSVYTAEMKAFESTRKQIEAINASNELKPDEKERLISAATARYNFDRQERMAAGRSNILGITKLLSKDEALKQMSEAMGDLVAWFKDGNNGLSATETNSRMDKLIDSYLEVYKNRKEGGFVGRLKREFEEARADRQDTATRMQQDAAADESVNEDFDKWIDLEGSQAEQTSANYLKQIYDLMLEEQGKPASEGPKSTLDFVTDPNEKAELEELFKMDNSKELKKRAKSIREKKKNGEELSYGEKAILEADSGRRAAKAEKNQKTTFDILNAVSSVASSAVNAFAGESKEAQLGMSLFSQGVGAAAGFFSGDWVSAAQQGAQMLIEVFKYLASMTAEWLHEEAEAAKARAELWKDSYDELTGTFGDTGHNSYITLDRIATLNSLFLSQMERIGADVSSIERQARKSSQGEFSFNFDSQYREAQAMAADYQAEYDELQSTKWLTYYEGATLGTNASSFFKSFTNGDWKNNLTGGLWDTFSTMFGGQDRKAEYYRRVAENIQEAQAALHSFLNVESDAEANTKLAAIKARGDAMTETYIAGYYQLLEQRKEVANALAAEEANKGKDQDQDAIKEYKRQLQELNKEIIEYVHNFAAEVYDMDIFSWAETLSDALVDAFKNGEDAAEKFHDTVNSILEDVWNRVIQHVVFDPFIKKIDEKLFGKADANGVLQGGIFSEGAVDNTNEAVKEAVAFLKGMMDAETDSLVSQAEYLYEQGKALGIYDTESGSSTSASIQGITEETADILAAYINGMRGDLSIQRSEVEWIRKNTDEMLALMVKANSASQNKLVEAAIQKANTVKIEPISVESNPVSAISSIGNVANQDLEFAETQNSIFGIYQYTYKNNLILDDLKDIELPEINATLDSQLEQLRQQTDYLNAISNHTKAMMSYTQSLDNRLKRVINGDDGIHIK